MSFWNDILPEDLNRTLNSRAKPPFAGYFPASTEQPALYDPFTEAHVNYADRSTDNPIRKLQFLLHRSSPNRTDMYQTQSTSSFVNPNGNSNAADPAAPSPENTFVLGDNKNVLVRADSTLNVLIVMIIIFLLINVVIIFAYYLRRNYFKRNMKRKLDVLSLDGTTDDELKRSNKFNDGDESFILDIVRRKNEYVPVKRTHSPINGFLLSRHYSTSTMDTHTKVSDWISHEVNCHSPKMRTKSPSFSMGDAKSFFGGRQASGGINAAAAYARPERAARQRPIELMKSKSFDTRDTIICQEVDVRSELLDSVDLRNSKRHDSDSTLLNGGGGADFVLHMDRRPMGAPFGADEEITSFIEDVDVDVNVTSRDECDGATAHFQLSPEETLQIIQMRNYPKVLPRYPDHNSDYVSTSSFKRRSMPSYQHMAAQYGRSAPPAPPPRTISTLDRKSSMKRSNSDNNGAPAVPTVASLAQRANEPPSPPIEEEPEITNALHVGPLLPGSKENLYSTLNRKQSQPPSAAPPAVTFQFEPCDAPRRHAEHTNHHPKSIMKNAFSSEDHAHDSAHSQSTNSTSNIPHTSRNEHESGDAKDERNRSESTSSADTSSSSAETVKHFELA